MICHQEGMTSTIIEETKPGKQTFKKKGNALWFTACSDCLLAVPSPDLFLLHIGNGNPLQYCCLGSPMDRGAWWAAVQRVAKSWTGLSDWTYTHTHTHHIGIWGEEHNLVYDTQWDWFYISDLQFFKRMNLCYCKWLNFWSFIAAAVQKIIHSSSNALSL